MACIDNLTLGEIKELMALFPSVKSQESKSLSDKFVGEKVIIRTYAAGVHYGEVAETCGKEIILKNSRRLWYWKTANKGISLSEVATSGLSKDSKVCESVDKIWLEAVEIIPCTKEAIKSIEAQDVHKA